MRRQSLRIKKKWTPQELEILRLLAANGFPARIIAQRLGRTRQSVRSCAMRQRRAIARPERRDPAQRRSRGSALRRARSTATSRGTRTQ